MVRAAELEPFTALNCETASSPRHPQRYGWKVPAGGTGRAALPCRAGGAGSRQRVTTHAPWAGLHCCQTRRRRISIKWNERLPGAAAEAAATESMWSRQPYIAVCRGHCVQ